MMRRDLRFTLLPEGTSDRALMPILDWVLAQHFSTERWTIVGSVVQFDRLPPGKASTLVDRIKTAADIYPCEILFVHRDADSGTIEERENGILAAVISANLINTVSPVAVIPVQMTEAWLLIDECAIRTAAGYRNGTANLALPTVGELERRADPKGLLQKALRTASGRTGRKLRIFNLNEARSMIASYIEDMSRLRSLDSFKHLESAVKATADRGQPIA
jgi:hypothetical protein